MNAFCKQGNSYVLGHNRKGKLCLKKTRKKMSITHIGKPKELQDIRRLRKKLNAFHSI